MHRFLRQALTYKTFVSAFSRPLRLSSSDPCSSPNSMATMSTSSSSAFHVLVHRVVFGVHPLLLVPAFFMFSLCSPVLVLHTSSWRSRLSFIFFVPSKNIFFSRSFSHFYTIHVVLDSLRVARRTLRRRRPPLHPPRALRSSQLQKERPRRIGCFVADFVAFARR